MDSKRNIDSILYRLLRNSKGYTLPYVLLILAVLSLFIPPLLNMISTRQTTDNQRIDEKEANYLAESAAEAYILFLKSFTIPPTLSNLTGYKGYSSPAKTISLPGGKTYSYYLGCTGPDVDYNYTLKVNVQVGKSSKTILYTFNATPLSTGGGGGSTGGGIDPLLSSSTPKDNVGVITGSTDENFQTDFANTVPTQFDFPQQTKVGTTTIWSSLSDITLNKDAILNNSSPGSTVTIELSTNSLNLDSNMDLQSLFPDRKIVLYVTGPNNSATTVTIDEAKGGGSLQMNGLLIVNGDLNNYGSITLGTSSLPGSLIVNGQFNMDGQHATFTTVNGTLAAYNYDGRVGNSEHLKIYGTSSNTFSYPSGYSTSSWSPDPNRSQ